MTTGTPLAQNSGRCVYDVHKVRVRRIQVPGPVVVHVKYDGRVQAGDPADFSRLDEVGRQTSDVRPDAVPATFSRDAGYAVKNRRYPKTVPREKLSRLPFLTRWKSDFFLS